MKRVLVINPNTTLSVTERVVDACSRAQPGWQWQGVTARFGAPYIADEASYAIAAHAVLDAHEAQSDLDYDAVLIACFGDPGLLALRERARVPVFGLAQASFEAAARQGRFAVVTGGRAWGPMLRRFARAHQLDDKLVGIHTIELTGAQIAADPSRALGALADAANRGVAEGAQVILLGGAALSGLAVALQAHVAVPVLDNVLVAAKSMVEAEIFKVDKS